MRPGDDRVGELEAELERRLKQLDHREAALKKIADTVMKKRPTPASPAPSEPRGRFGRRRPDARVRELEAEVEELRRQLAEREHTSPAPAPLPPHEPAPKITGRPTLPQLEELAAYGARARRPEADEWAVYVDLLREHAREDGTIPPQFDDILRDVFGARF